MIKNKAKVQARILENLRQIPVVEVAVKKAGISRATYYRWCKEDPAFHQSVLYAEEWGRHYINDLAESKLVQNIQDNSMPAIRFWLQNNHNKYRREPIADQQSISKYFGSSGPSPDEVLQENFFEILRDLHERKLEAIKLLPKEEQSEQLLYEIERMGKLRELIDSETRDDEALKEFLVKYLKLPPPPGL